METERQAVRSENVEWNGRRRFGNGFVVEEDGNEGSRGSDVEMVAIFVRLLSDIFGDVPLNSGYPTAANARGLGRRFMKMEDQFDGEALNIGFGKIHGDGEKRRRFRSGATRPPSYARPRSPQEMRRLEPLE